ncbi:MAG: rRNA pseudouridine synthase [Bacteroidaceae bacterium]|nr:rRNA pseudouridine synthase [Bacteroidaceae bacterium]
MDNYKEKRQGGYAPRGGNRERSFNSDFNAEYRKKQRPRFTREQDGQRQYGGSGYRNNDYRGNSSEGGKRYTSYQRPQYNNGAEGETNYNRYDSRPAERQYGQGRQGGYRSEGRSVNNGNYSRAYSTQHRASYGQRGNRSTAYDPNAKYSNKKRIVYREAAIDPNAPLRLNKYLANAGVCSRREADNYIAAGLVSVNGTVVTELGVKVTPVDDIRFNGERVNPERKVYVLLNKPKDCVTTVEDPQERRTVLDCLKGIGKERIYPVGRLDRNTTGVLLLTNDGDMASKLTHPKFMKKKIYHVTCDKNVAMSDMDLLASGIELEDGPIYADEVSYVNDADRSQIGIEIHSGKNRIVRRMMEHLGYRVVKLDRVLFAGLTKKNLKRVDWRYLTEKEVNMLRMGAYE